MLRVLILLVGIFPFLMSGCSTLTGIPSHGGGKRFFVEQELISASARASIQCIDLTQIEGKNCALYMSVVGDQGGGNLIGGQYQWQAALRGDYISNPTTRTQNRFPVIDSATVTTDGSGNPLSVIQSQSPLNFPSNSTVQTEGADARGGIGFGFNGNGQFNSQGFLNDDTSYLGAIIREALILKGAGLTPPQNADVFLYVTVDAFGTNRSRTEMHLYNQERLQAKTALHITAFDKKGRVVVPTQTASWEADYRERYVLWCGPFEVEKRVYQSDDLMVDFRNLSAVAHARGNDEQLKEENEKQQKKSGDLELSQPLPINQQNRNSTRPNQLIRPQTRPDPTRPEDTRQQQRKNNEQSSVTFQLSG